MKKIFLNKNYFIVAIAIISIITFNSCSDKENYTLGELPSADFTFTPSATNANLIVFTNTSTSVGMAYWEIPGLNLTTADLKGDEVSATFTFSGTYPVTFYLLGQGGMTKVTKNVTINQNDPNACNGTAIGFLTGCGTKTWKMNPAPNAFWVSQWAGGDGSWWASDANSVTERPCAFNDEHTFVFNAAGDFIFDDKGDFYSDGYLGNSPNNSCQSSSNYTAEQAPWASGNFKYVVIPTGGYYGLGQIKLIGLGAHIGIQKAINNNEITSGATATSITYDIKSMVHDPAGYDLLTITMHYASWSATQGWWTYTLRSY